MFEIASYRHTTATSLSTIADIVAENSSAALMFDDRRLAEEIVSGLRVEPEISCAARFDENAGVVATYPSDLPASEVPTPAHVGVVLHWNDVAQALAAGSSVHLTKPVKGRRWKQRCGRSLRQPAAERADEITLVGASRSGKKFSDFATGG